MLFLLPVCSGCTLSSPEPETPEPFSCAVLLLELGCLVAIDTVSLFAASSALRRSTPAPPHANCSARTASSTLMHTQESMVDSLRAIDERFNSLYSATVKLVPSTAGLAYIPSCCIPVVLTSSCIYMTSLFNNKLWQVVHYHQLCDSWASVSCLS